MTVQARVNLSHNMMSWVLSKIDVIRERDSILHRAKTLCFILWVFITFLNVPLIYARDVSSQQLQKICRFTSHHAEYHWRPVLNLESFRLVLALKEQKLQHQRFCGALVSFQLSKSHYVKRSKVLSRTLFYETKAYNESILRVCHQRKNVFCFS